MPPNITGISPSAAVVGTPIRITGTDFGAAPGTVSVGTLAAPATSWSATSIDAIVPGGAATGDVIVTAGGTPSTGVRFTVIPPPPSPDFIPKQLFDSRMKANDVLQEHLKQIITISSATLALTVSFVKDVIGSHGTQVAHGWFLPTSWVALAASIALAILSIAMLVDHLDKPNPVGGRSGYQKSFGAGTTIRVAVATLITFAAFAVGMGSLAALGAFNYKLFLNKGDNTYRFLSEANAVEIAQKSLAPGTEFLHTSKVELQPGGPRLAGSIAIWHVQMEVKQPSPAPGQPPVYTVVDYYVDAVNGRGTS